MPFKYLQKPSPKRSRLSDSLNSQRWRFLESNLDYSRAGLPYNTGPIQHPKGPLPSFVPIKPKGQAKLLQTRKPLIKPQTCSFKINPTLQAQKNRIAQIEHCLRQHSLVLYPHLKESIPPELFKEVLDVLDPEMLPVREEVDVDVRQECELPYIMEYQLENKRSRCIRRSKLMNSKDHKGKDPYTWFSKKEIAVREKEARRNYVPPLDENVKRAVKELCRWFDSLGGEKHDIDEATIISLFDTGCEIEPPPLPINVVELDNLPAELRQGDGVLPLQCTVKGSQIKEPYKSRGEKIRYGAWYLDPKTWKKQKISEPLEDPKSKDSRAKHSRRASDEKDMEITQLHGTYAFKEFLEIKHYRIPQFLEEMLAVQDASGPREGAFRSKWNEFQKCEDSASSTRVQYKN